MNAVRIANIERGNSIKGKLSFVKQLKDIGEMVPKPRISVLIDFFIYATFFCNADTLGKRSKTSVSFFVTQYPPPP